MPDFGAQQGVFVGTPDQIVVGVAAFFDAGIDEMIFELPDAFDLDALALANEVLAPLARAPKAHPRVGAVTS